MAEQQPVRVRYQLTLEDYSEANRAHAGNRPWLSWPYFGALAIYPLFLTATYAGESQQAVGKQESSLFDLLVTLFPLIVCLVISTVVLIKISRLNGQPWRRGKHGIVSVRAAKQARLFTFLFVAIAGVCLIAYRIYRATQQPTTDPLEQPVVQAIAELIPGVILAGFFLILFFFTAGDRYGRAWQLQTNLHHPIDLEADDNVVIVTEINCQTRHAWAYFAGYMESPNLFLIYNNALSFHIIPKRAFVDDSQAELLRSRLSRFIAEQPAPQLQAGFPLKATPAEAIHLPNQRSTPPPLPTARP